VQVHHGQPFQDVGADEAAEGDHHPQLGPGVEDVVDAVAHGQTQLLGRGLDRSGQQVRSPGPAPVGLGDDEGDLVALVDQRPQRRHGRFRAPQEGQAGQAGPRLSRRPAPAGFPGQLQSPGPQLAHGLLALLGIEALDEQRAL
jgi:hypothetical protein